MNRLTIPGLSALLLLQACGPALVYEPGLRGRRWRGRQGYAYTEYYVPQASPATLTVRPPEPVVIAPPPTTPTILAIRTPAPPVVLMPPCPAGTLVVLAGGGGIGTPTIGPIQGPGPPCAWHPGARNNPSDRRAGASTPSRNVAPH